MKRLVPALAVLLAVFASAPGAFSQQAPYHQRLPPESFDVVPPSERVRGAPGEMTVERRPCRVLPLAETRRRIVDVAVQEWGFFGFPVFDQTIEEAFSPQRVVPAAGTGAFGVPDVQRGSPWRLSLEDSLRVAASVAGYWAVTPEGAGMVARQDRAWNGAGGWAGRWADPWSAAFVSWVMCEAGLGEASRFQRAIAHRVYIDQAIRARDGAAPQAAFVAYDIGEEPIVPGDLLCASRRPLYRTIAERRRQMGVGARSHCDVVVKVDEAGGRILAIGGNVRRSVNLKILPAVRQGASLRPSMANGARPVFAHLKLRAEPIEANALDNSPTIQAFACAAGLPRDRVAAVAAVAAEAPDRC